MAYCRWYEKRLEDVAEHEQEQCNENGQNCMECPDLIVDMRNTTESAGKYAENAEGGK